jgi:hypothetical protein
MAAPATSSQPIWTQTSTERTENRYWPLYVIAGESHVSAQHGDFGYCIT